LGKQATQKRTIDPSELMTQTEAAADRGVTLASINELVHRKRLRVVEMFGRKLVVRAEVKKFKKLKPGPKGAFRGKAQPRKSEVQERQIRNERKQKHTKRNTAKKKGGLR
jgi:hypothetical protein